MKDFIHHTLSIAECLQQLGEFEDLLSSKEEIQESELLLFFGNNLHLAAFIGTYVSDLVNPDRIATEYDIFGDFVCDLAIRRFKLRDVPVCRI